MKGRGRQRPATGLCALTCPGLSEACFPLPVLVCNILGLTSQIIERAQGRGFEPWKGQSQF